VHIILIINYISLHKTIRFIIVNLLCVSYLVMVSMLDILVSFLVTRKIIVETGLEPGWLGASFGLRISYVRIIITRYDYLWSI
jgi:hypothetical protein